MILFRTHYNINNEIIRIKKIPDCSPTIIRLKELKGIREVVQSKLNQENLLTAEFARLESITTFDDRGTYFPSVIAERLRYFVSSNLDNVPCTIVPYKGIIFYIISHGTVNSTGGIAAFIGETSDKSEVLVINSNIGSVKNLIAKSYRKAIAPSGLKPKIFIVNLDNYCKPKLRADVLIDSITLSNNIKSKLSIDFKDINSYIYTASSYGYPSDGVSNSVMTAIFGLRGEPLPNNYLINVTEEHNIQAT